jgi:hypothetical protein
MVGDRWTGLRLQFQTWQRLFHLFVGQVEYVYIDVSTPTFMLRSLLNASATMIHKPISVAM